MRNSVCTSACSCLLLVFLGQLTAQTIPPRSASIHGTVRDAVTKEAIPDAQIVIVNGKIRVPGPFADTTTTSIDGTFKFDSLYATTAPFSYFVQVRKDRYVFYQSDALAPKDSETISIDILIQRNVFLHIRTYSGTLGLKGSYISILEQNQSYYPSWDTTDLSGWASFGPLRQGQYCLTVAADGYQTIVVDHSISGEVWDDTLPISLTPPISPMKRLQGRVHDRYGNPISGEVLWLFASLDSTTLALSCLTDSAGAFLFSGIPNEVRQASIYNPYFLEDTLQVRIDDTLSDTDLVFGLPYVLSARGHQPALSAAPQTHSLPSITYDAMGRRIGANTFSTIFAAGFRVTNSSGKSKTHMIQVR